MTKTYTVDYFQDRKLKYEKNHGVFIHQFMFTEFSNRILGQCNVALNDLQRQLDLEIARAKAEEARIEAKAHSELGKIYNYINPSSSTYEDALNSEEPLKYTELAHVDGDSLAEHGQKDLNSAYNTSMTVLMQVINGMKENGGTELLQRLVDYLHIADIDINNLPEYEQLTYTGIGTTQDPEQNYTDVDIFHMPGWSLQEMNDATIDSIVKVIQWILDKLNKTIYPYASWQVNTNELETTTPNTRNKTLPNALSDSYNAISQSLHAINELYLRDNTDGYTLNDQGRLVKKDQQTKLISNYNDSLMFIAQAINRLAEKVEDLEQTKA